MDHHHLDLFYLLKSTPNPPPLNSLLSFLKVPVVSSLLTPCKLPHPSPFHRSPNIVVGPGVGGELDR